MPNLGGVLCRTLLLILAGTAAASDNAHETTARKRTLEASQNARGSDFKTDSTVVLVNVTITDGHGRLVTGLPKESFQVFEEKAEQTVRYFWAEDAPVSVGLVLDFSHSMSNKFGELREAVSQFFRTANPEDEFCLIEFRDRPELSIAFTGASESIENRVAMAQPEGQTALLDAVYMGLREMKKARNPRKALLVVSDGGDNHSRFRAREVRNLARESDVEIYSIGIQRREEPLLGDFAASAGVGLLSEISEEGGGRYYGVEKLHDLAEVAEKIGKELRHQYVLGYVSTNQRHDGKYRRIQVKVRRPPGQAKVWANWKHGYYAPVD